MSIATRATALLLAALLAAPVTAPTRAFADDDDDDAADGGADPRDRGMPWEYDPGPDPRSQWAKLFASVPNYRAIGQAVLGGAGEKFRWTFGPMFYRGRLAPNSVKVFVVGQEGAQDESISNRSFTGGTGAKMQHFLKHIGVNQSYLFMNTFVYTINGQYGGGAGGNDASPEMFWLAQNPESPIVRHRHAQFDYMLSLNKNTLALVVAVGKAAKDTVVAWVQAHGGNCPDIMSCDGSRLAPGVQITGVVHPGGAGKGADVNKIAADFQRAANQVAGWQKSVRVPGRPAWLVPDVAGYRIPPRYAYRSSAVPFRDFAFGTNQRMGRGGTSSNRKDGQQSIQVFSAAGAYNAEGANIAYQKPADLARGIEDMPPADLAWEAPKSNPEQYDPGPGPELAQLLLGGTALKHPNYTALGVTQHASFGFNGVYRGRLQGAQLLVLADQESVDDLFTGRALTGEGGQRLQTWINSIGVGPAYAILRTIPVDTSDITDVAQLIKIATHPQLSAIRKAAVAKILAQGQVKAVVAVGPAAAAVVDGLGLPRMTVVKLAAATDPGRAASWTEGHKALRGQRPYADQLSSIPRIDLPIQTKWWVGTSGSRAVRALDRGTNRPSGDYYKVFMPDWAFRQRARPMSSVEATAVGRARR